MAHVGGILMIQIEDRSKAELDNAWTDNTLAKILPPANGDIIEHLLKQNNFNVFPSTKSGDITEYMAMFDGEWNSNIEDAIAFLEKYDAHLSGIFRSNEGTIMRSFHNELKPKGLLDGGDTNIRKSLIDEL